MAWDWVAIIGFALLAAYCALKGGGVCSARRGDEPVRRSETGPGV